MRDRTRVIVREVIGAVHDKLDGAGERVFVVELSYMKHEGRPGYYYASARVQDEYRGGRTTSFSLARGASVKLETAARYSASRLHGMVIEPATIEGLRAKVYEHERAQGGKLAAVAS